MSTDDLTRRALRWAAQPSAHGRGASWVGQLADEVDGLREAMNAQSEHHDRALDRLTAERDAARAALGRVKEFRDQWNEEAGDLVPPLDPGAAYNLQRDHIDQITDALEGES